MATVALPGEPMILACTQTGAPLWEEAARMTSMVGPMVWTTWRLAHCHAIAPNASGERSPVALTAVSTVTRLSEEAIPVHLLPNSGVAIRRGERGAPSKIMTCGGEGGVPLSGSAEAQGGAEGGAGARDKSARPKRSRAGDDAAGFGATHDGVWSGWSKPRRSICSTLVSEEEGAA